MTTKIELTPEQEKAFRDLNDPHLDQVVVTEEVMKQLTNLGLIYRRDDGNMDTTDKGEALYDSLTM